MRPISELAHGNARWIGAVRWKRHFELRQGEQHFASLTWENASGSVVVARTRESLWVLERTGLCGSRIAIREDVRGPEVATFTADWKSGGRLTLAGAGHFSWGAPGVSLARWIFRDARSRPLLELRVDSMRLVPSGTLAVVHDAIGEPALPLLVTLGWYLTVQTLDDASLLVSAVG